uniref:Uncharacterized protein n=1 Tax=Anguilla anguilla TaxID=7936 RepID=A0A0E9QUF6_ANGAN
MLHYSSYFKVFFCFFLNHTPSCPGLSSVQHWLYLRWCPL